MGEYVRTLLMFTCGTCKCSTVIITVIVWKQDLSWHSNNRDEADTYSQSMSNSCYTPSFAQSYGLHGVLGKPDWFLNFSYSESHQAEELQHEVRF
jgi:hypothetical protein